MLIHNHRIEGDRVHHLNCPKNSCPAEIMDAVIFHYTAGSSGRSSARYLADRETKASAHLVIDRSGEVWQLVPFNIQAWHAGRSAWGGRTRFNRFSIGIELDNRGPLTRRGDRFFNLFGGEVMPSDVYTDYRDGVLSFWHSYPAVQLNVLIEICRLIRQAYPIRHWLGHSDISAHKRDPGPAFPAERVVENILKNPVHRIYPDV